MTQKKMRDSELFDKAVAKLFEPIARRLNFPLTKVADGIYDILSPHFIMRIRLDTGHARGLNVILRSASWRDIDENDSKVPQLGITCFTQFHGEKLQDTFINVYTDEDFIRQAKLLAKAAECYGIPYLLGEGKDWEVVREEVRKKTKINVEKIRKMKMPSFVQKRWHLPPPDFKK